jgi:protein SCO1/2
MDHLTIKMQPSLNSPNQRFSRHLWILLLAVPILLVMAFAIFQPIQVLPRRSIAPAYDFIDQAGQQFTSDSMRGSMVLYTFSHSQCTAPCTPTSATLAAMQRQLSDVPIDDIPLQFVTLFVDPEVATPTRLQTMAESLEIDPATWHFVTGEADRLKQVIGLGFSTYYGEESNGSFTVDPVFVLVDGLGLIRAVYRTPAPDIAIIKRDLGLLAQEAQNSSGVYRYAYEAAHLFLCYPK